MTKSLLEIIKKGDIEAVKSEQSKLGIKYCFLIDDAYKHNAIFYATQIKDEE